MGLDLQEIKRFIQWLPGNSAAYQLRDSMIKLLASSPRMSEISGFTQDEYVRFVADDVWNIVIPSDRPLLASAIQRCLQPPYEEECIYRIRQKQQEYAWVHARARKIGLLEGYPVILVVFHSASEENVAHASLLEDTDHPIFVCDDGSKELLYANRAAREDSPQPEASYVGKKCYAYLYGRTSICPDCRARSLEIGGQLELVRHDADTGRYERITQKGILWYGHKACVHYIDDITEIKRQEERYKRSIEDLLEANPQALGLFHLNLTRNWCGDAYGPTEREISIQHRGTADGFFQALQQLLVREEDRAVFRHQFQRKKLLAAFRRGQTYITYDYERKDEVGEAHWATLCARLAQNPWDRDIEAVVYALDITEEMRREQISRRLTNEEYDFVAVVNIPRAFMEFFSRKDGLDSVLELGRKYSEQDIHALMRETVVEDDLSEFVTKLTLENVRERMAETPEFALTLFQHDRQGRRFRKQVKFCWLNERKNEVLVIKSDITELYQLEQEHMQKIHDAWLAAEKANEAKSAFLANISHDMRTPLNGILGFTDLALRADSREQRLDYLAKIKLSGNFLLDLINDTLDLSKIESGKLILNPESVSLRDLLEEVIVPIRSLAESKSIEFELRTSALSFSYIWADPLKLQKIFLNLLSNAMKFTLSGGRVILLAEGPGNFPQGSNCHIMVQDTGIGISPEFLPKVFLPFAQEYTEQTKNILGTGLGLAIVKRMIGLMGGTITVQSEPGKGTRFDVWLTLESASGPEQPVAGKIRQQAACLAGLRVLVCEDNSLNMEIVTSLLGERGIEVVCAADGCEGVEIFRTSKEGTFSGILMDIRMPVMDGYEAAQRIRHLPREDAKKVPIIALSGDAYEEDIKKCLEVGMDSHLAKPINPNKLFYELERLCVTK